MLVQLVSTRVRKGECHVLFVDFNVPKTSDIEYISPEELQGSARHVSLVLRGWIHLVGRPRHEVVDLRQFAVALEMLRQQQGRNFHILYRLYIILYINIFVFFQSLHFGWWQQTSQASRNFFCQNNNMLIRNYTNQTEMIIISLMRILLTPFQISNMPKDILSRVANLWHVHFEFEKNVLCY